MPSPFTERCGMGITQTEIANIALLKMGKNPITNIEDNTNHYAAIIRQSWGLFRDSELRNHAWLFAIRREELPALAEAPVFGYPYAYQAPADCLRLISVNGENALIDLSPFNTEAYSRWQIEGRQILSFFESPLRVRYIWRVENTTLWDASFIELFACRIAAELTMKVNGSANDRQLAWQEYAAARTAAYKNNAIEMDAAVYPDSSFIISRMM